MKKWISLMLALVMALTACSAFAAKEDKEEVQSVTVKITVDPEVAKNVMTQFGMTEEQFSQIEPYLAVFCPLTLKETYADGGVQFDMDVKDTNVLSLAVAITKNGFAAGSNLIPNTVITAPWTTLLDMAKESLKQTAFTLIAMAAESIASGAGENAEENSVDWSAAFKAASGYITKFTAACSTTVAPGETEKGTYEYEGYTFDQHMPVKVDVKGMIDAWTTLVKDLMTDKDVTAALKSIPGFDAQQILQSAGTVNEEYIPNVTVDVYNFSDGSEVFYSVSETTFKGAEAPAQRFTILNKGEGSGTIHFEMEEETTWDMDFGPDSFTVGYTMFGTWYGVNGTIVESRDVYLDIFALDKEKPVMNIAVLLAEKAERTLSLDTEGKAEVNIADFMGENANEALSGLLSDFMANGMAKLMAVPKVSALIDALMTPKVTTPEEEEGKPEAVTDTDITEWKTVADVLSLDTNGMDQTAGGGKYYAAFLYGGKYYIVEADLSDELYEQIMALDVFAEDYDAQRLALLGPCEITYAADVSTLALPQEELDAWIGKTGQDLMDAGWEYLGYQYDNHSLCAVLGNGDIQYIVSFSDELAQPEGEKDLDYAGATITGIKLNGVNYHFYEEKQPAEQ